MDAGSYGSVPTKSFKQNTCFHSNPNLSLLFLWLTHNGTSGLHAPPKIPARSKTPLRSVKKGTPEVSLDEASAGAPARKQKGTGTVPAPATKVEPAVAQLKKAEMETPAPPASPKVYVRKVKGKAKKESKS